MSVNDMRLPSRFVVALAGVAIAAATRFPTPAVGADSPTVVVFAVDTSGSLRAADLARAGRLAAGILESLPAGSEAALLTFDDQARMVVPRTSRHGEIAAALAALRRRGRHTALNDALYDATRYLRDAGPGRRALVLITDGRDEESAVELADGLAVAQQSGIPVFTVGVGDVEQRVLRRVAKLTGGQYTPLGAARPGQIAARVAAFDPPPPSTPPRPVDGRADERSSRSPAAPAGNAAVPASAPAPTGSRRAAWLVLIAALGLAAYWWWRRRRRAPMIADDLADDSPAPTVIERMSSTEEFLEKTVTLQEKPVLTITRGPDVGQVFELQSHAAMSIGRAKANHVVVNDVSVSSEHCRIRPEDGRFVLHDLKSTNGTYVNERRVTRHVLQEGDLLKIGETSLLFKTDLKRT